MKHFTSPLAARLDLAREAAEVLRGAANTEIPGVREDVSQQDGITVHCITILNETGSQALGRPPGHYITLELPPPGQLEDIRRAAAQTARQLKKLLPPIKEQPVLVAGLGNHDAVPDSLGPAVINRTYATQHIFSAKDNEGTPQGLARLCCIAPGVLGLSGIETADILKGICDRIHPAVLIVIDALAAASVKRVGSTVQMTDSGIVPGSGLGRGRTALDAETLGCPIIAMGVPTIVDTVSIIREAAAAMRRYRNGHSDNTPPEDDDAACLYAEKQLLQLFPGRLLVTPKDIDQLIADMAETLATGIAIAVHPGCTAQNCFDFIR